MSPLADVRLARQGGVRVAAIAGEIDLSNAADLRSALERAVASEDPGLVLDLSGASYLDSSGIKLVFDLARALARRQQQLRVVVPEDSRLARTVMLVEMRSAVPVDQTTGDAVTAIGAELGPRSADTG